MKGEMMRRPNGLITVKMQRVKETSGAYQYKELNEDGNVIDDFRSCKIGTIYIRKPNPTPILITVTINNIHE